MKARKIAALFAVLGALLLSSFKLTAGQTVLMAPAATNAPLFEEADSQIISEVNTPSLPVSEPPKNLNTAYSHPFPENGIPVLMYHSISTDPDNSNCVSKEQFTEEMDWLYRHNYHPLTVEELDKALNQNAHVPENPILITLDDGYADNYLTAWPILKQYGFHATFFIVTDSVGPNSIDWSQLNELVSQGNSIGSHSVHHYDLETITDSQQEEELLESKKVLEDHLGIPIRAFCYPSGKYNETTLELLSQAGYALSFTTEPGKVYLKDNPYELHRVRIWNGMLLAGFEYVVT